MRGTGSCNHISTNHKSCPRMGTRREMRRVTRVRDMKHNLSQNVTLDSNTTSEIISNVLKRSTPPAI